MVVAAFALFIARLRRAERPRFEPVARVGRVEVGRVLLARRSERSGQVLGWSVVCDGREVFARLGDVPIGLEGDDGGGVVVVRDGEGGRVGRIAPGGCELRWTAR